MNEVISYANAMWQALTHSFILRSILSAIASVAIWLIGLKHVQVLGIFILLVFIDLFTKWAAIAYKMLVDDGADGIKLSAIDKYIAIPCAFERKLISSEYMRKGFVKKILTYVAATAAAFLFDSMAGGITNKSSFAVNLVWLYLGSAEFLSILENLRDGGNQSMGKFLDLVKTKIESRVKL